MNQNLTELVFVVDRSGSMHGLEADTIGGFNRVLEENKAMDGEANLTTILFDHTLTLLHNRLPIRGVMPMTDKDYRPGGSTALLDAIGEAITRTDNVQQSVSEEYRPGKVQIIILTDGFENASREYSATRIRSMITDRQARGWDFLFLGANMDAVLAAERLGIETDRAVTAISDRDGVSKQYDAVIHANRAYRSKGDRSAAWKRDVEEDTNRRKPRR